MGGATIRTLIIEAPLACTGADVIVIEFIVFVVSSGLFYSSRFRHHLWAVLIAGGIATGSSLIFFYDLYEKLEMRTEASVKVVKEVVRVPVVQHISRPPALSKPENCRSDYPLIARIFDQEGTTELGFQVMADGTLSDIKVTKSSGSDRLDDAAVDCVAKWHYRPAIVNDQLADAPMTVKVDWNLSDNDPDKPASGAK
jgi:TonB family protein